MTHSQSVMIIQTVLNSCLFLILFSTIVLHNVSSQIFDSTIIYRKNDPKLKYYRFTILCNLNCPVKENFKSLSRFLTPVKIWSLNQFICYDFNIHLLSCHLITKTIFLTFLSLQKGNDESNLISELFPHYWN